MTTPNQSTPRLFEAVPVSEPPTKDDWHTLVRKDGTLTDSRQFVKGEWEITSTEILIEQGVYTHWLRPVPGIVVTEEKLREVIGEAFDGGQSYHHYSDGPGPYAPDQTTYVQNKIKELFK